MPKLPKNIEEKIAQELSKINFRRVKYTNTVVSYQLNLETELSLFVDIKTAKTSVQIDFYNTHNLFREGFYFCHFGMGEYEDVKEEYLKFDGWFNLEKLESFEFVDIVCLLGAKHLIQDFGTIQKCLATEKKYNLPEYCFGSEIGWINFGLLNAIYGDKKRAVELLEKFVNTDFSYEYMGEKRHSKCDVIRQKYAKLALENVENKNKILELIKQINVELDEI